jgi:hypothetical protein
MARDVSRHIRCTRAGGPNQPDQKESVMKSTLGLVLAVSLAAAVATGGCGGTPTTPTPAAPTTTDTFNGTLAQGGSNIHTFTLSQIGEVDATLTAVGPLSTLALGFVLGAYDGTNCNPGFQNLSSLQGQLLAGSTTATGTFCVRVFDVGNIVAGTTVTYTVTVAHP